VKAPVRAYWDAYNDNDLDAMREQIHPSSPNGPSESDVSFEETVTVESVDVRTESEPNATVDVRAKRGDQSESSLLVFQMRTERTENGLTWYIWSDDTFTDGYSGLKAPTPFFDYDYDRDATDSDDTTVVTVSNASDPIDATLLSIRGTGFVNPAGASPEVTEGGTTWAEATGDQQIDFGDEVTIGVASGYEVNFVWEYEGVTSTVESFEDI